MITITSWHNVFFDSQIRLIGLLPFFVRNNLLAQATSPDEANQMFQSLDVNKDGILSREDQTQNNRTMLDRIIQMAGKPADGKVNRSEFDTVFQ